MHRVFAPPILILVLSSAKPSVANRCASRVALGWGALQPRLFARTDAAASVCGLRQCCRGLFLSKRAGGVSRDDAAARGEDDIGPLRVMRLSASAKLPERGSAGAVGYDLFASEDALVPARGSALVATGIAIAIPHGCYGRVAPRSGLAVKHSIHVGAGVIDPDYRGEVKVLLLNLGDSDFRSAAGTRIAQEELKAESSEVADRACFRPHQHSGTAELTIPNSGGTVIAGRIGADYMVAQWFPVAQ